MQEKFKALGHDVRLRIYRALREGKLCVCELTELLDMSQPAVSQHLSKLKDAGLIESERHGQWMFYVPSNNRFRDALEDLLGESPGELRDSLAEVRRMDLCDLRDDCGNLPEEG